LKENLEDNDKDTFYLAKSSKNEKGQVFFLLGF
jgi:hypothetical protein